MPRPAKVRSISWTVSPKSTLVLREILAIAVNSFRADKVRATMTALGMVIGTFSLVLVVTIALTGKQYVLNEIQNIGANLIWAEYAGAANAGASAGTADYLTVDDMSAVQQQVPGVQAASPVLNLHEPILVGNGKQRDLLILGVNPEYVNVRRIVVSSGRFFDQQDSQSHHKVALVTEDFAIRQYGGIQFASGYEINIQGLPFIVIGTFRESVETFGQSEIQDDTVLIPYSMARYLTDTNAVNQIYFSMSDGSSIPRATEKILAVLKARHRAESVYNVGNLTQVLSLVAKTANAFTIVLLLFATITLVAGGVGIMNIMLATVSARIREIGIRKAPRNPTAIPFRGGNDLLNRRSHRHSGRTGAPVFALGLHSVQAPRLRALRPDRHAGLLPDRDHLRHPAGQECFQIGSGGISKTRMREDVKIF